MFGFDEVIEGCDKRKTSVKCLYNNSLCYYIDKSQFINFANMFKFNEKVIQEQYLK